MPWCPFCAEEYQPGILRCSDCGSSLVPEAPLPDIPDDPTLPEELIRSRDPRFLDRAVEYLSAQAIPAQVVPLSAEPGSPGFALTVDAGFWQQAVDVIVPFLGASPEPDQSDPAKLLPESLNRPLTEIIEGGPDSLVDLAKALLVGDQLMLVKAEYALVHIGEPARRFLFELLLDAVDADDTWRVRRISQALARFARPETLASLLPYLDRNEHTVVLVTALGYLNDLNAVPALVRLLDHKDSSVRDEAAESLYNVAGESFDFEADDPPEVRAEAVEKWTRWMRHRGLY